MKTEPDVRIVVERGYPRIVYRGGPPREPPLWIALPALALLAVAVVLAVAALSHG